jgi:hypothetical protein
LRIPVEKPITFPWNTSGTWIAVSVPGKRWSLFFRKGFGSGSPSPRLPLPSSYPPPVGPR